MSEVDFGRGRSKQDLKADIETALRRHGIDIPGGMVDAYAEMAAAATGSRLMVLPRWGLLGARTAVRALRFVLAHRVSRDD